MPIAFISCELKISFQEHFIKKLAALICLMITLFTVVQTSAAEFSCENLLIKPKALEGDFLENKNRIDKELADQALLPGYAKDVDSIFFLFQRRGLTISLEQHPYTPFYHGPSETLFKHFFIRYDPKYFLPGSLVRRTLGNRPLTLTSADIRSVGSAASFGYDGEFLDIFFGTPGDIHHDIDNGPLLRINRSSGRIIMYPADINNAVLGFVRGLYSETQQRVSPISGQWFTSNHIIEHQPVRSQTQTSPQPAIAP